MRNSRQFLKGSLVFAQDKSPDFSAFVLIVYKLFIFSHSFIYYRQMIEDAYFGFISGLRILMACFTSNQLQRLKRITKPKLKEGTVYAKHFLSFIFLMKANVNSFWKNPQSFLKAFRFWCRVVILTCTHTQLREMGCIACVRKKVLGQTGSPNSFDWTHAERGGDGSSVIKRSLPVKLT